MKPKNRSMNRKPLREENNHQDELDMRELVVEFLDSLGYVDKDASGYYEYEFYPHYNDRIEDREVGKVLEGCKTLDDFYNYIDMAYDYYYEYEHDFVKDFVSFLEKKGIDPNDLDDSFLLETLGDYLYIHADYDFWLDTEYRSHIIVDTGDGNFDFSLNPNSSVTSGTDLGLDDEDVLNNASLIWLIKQQGHTVEELKAAWTEEGSHGKFMDSVVNEIYNATSSLNCLCFLCKATLRQLLEFNSDCTITINKCNMCGLFDVINGGGSVMELSLDKPVVIPGKYVGEFYVDTAKPINYYGYSVDDVYGLTDEAYSADIKITKGDGTILEGINATKERSLKESRWTYRIPSEVANRFRAAIDDADYSGLRDAMKEIYQLIYDNFGGEVFDEYELNDYIEEIDLADEDEDEYDYLLDNLYDFCDNMGVFIPLEESYTSVPTKFREVLEEEIDRAKYYIVDTIYPDETGEPFESKEAFLDALEYNHGVAVEYGDHPGDLEKIKADFENNKEYDEEVNGWVFIKVTDIPVEKYLGECLKEDTIKTKSGKWVNKGNTGETHGEFKTKKAADEQRKAMFAQRKKGAKWGESLEEDHIYIKRTPGIKHLHDGSLKGVDSKATYSIIVFKEKGKSGSNLLVDGADDAFDQIYFDTADEAQDFADKNFPDADFIMVRKNEYYDDSIGDYRVSAPWVSRENGKWTKEMARRSNRVQESVNRDTIDKLDARAQELYGRRNGFNEFTDDELALLWANCIYSEENPWGQAYDDEVYGAIRERKSADKIFAKAKDIFGKLFTPLS